MALVKKRSRLIMVDGVVYRWQVRRQPTYSQALGWSPLTFVVEHAEHPGRVLVVSTPVAHPGNWLNLPTVGVRPKTVASSVRAAIAAGWVATERGSPFLLALQ